MISIDDKCNIRIWDIRGMNTIQVITGETYLLYLPTLQINFFKKL